MERNPRAEHFQQVERELTSLLASLGDRLEPEDVAQVRQFIDVGEYGLSLETICGAIGETATRFPHDLYLHIAELGQDMGMQAEVWERIGQLADS